MRAFATLFLPVAAGLALSGCMVVDSVSRSMGLFHSGSDAKAALMATAAVTPNTTAGTVTFAATSGGVMMIAEVTGLPPGTERGFHIHEKGDCGNNGDAAGGHFNPGGHAHGRYAVGPSHGGDMPSLVADASGNARIHVELRRLSLGTGAANDILGKAVIVHRDKDDYMTQPNGNAGPRIACGIIEKG